MKRALFDTVTVLPYAGGEAVHRLGYESAVLALSVAAGAQATVKVEHSDEAAGPFAAVQDSRLFVDDPVNADGDAVINNEAEADGIANLDIDLSGCKAYVKITVTGGEAGALVLGDAATMPVGRNSMQFAVSVAAEKDEAAAAMDKTIAGNIGSSPKGCTVDFDTEARSIAVVLTGSAADVSGTGLINTLTALTADGCKVTLGGEPIANVADVKATGFYASITGMTAGAEDVTAVVSVTDAEGTSVEYDLVVSYPA